MSFHVLTDPQITIDASAPTKPLNRFWEATGYANADFTYTKPFLRMYDYLDSYHNHLYYMRLHNILTLHGEGDGYFLKMDVDYGNQKFPSQNGINAQNGNDRVVTVTSDGTLCYHWELVDRVYDIIVNHGMVPIVEMCYIPKAICKSADDFILPADYHIYAEVVTAFVRHCQERYGVNELLNWYFEIWNEPDNQDQWCKDPSSFFAMYDYFETAVHRVDHRLRTGGPATKQFDNSYQMFELFLEHCSHGVNYASGGFGSRLDFISVHCKGGWPNDSNPSSDVMFDALHRYLDIIERYPEYRNTEFFNDESDIVWAGCKGIWENSWLDFRNTHYAPGFVCKMVSRYCTELVDQRGVNLAIVDSDNTHLQWERYLFSGNRSQFTPLGEYPSTHIIKKPFFNAYVLLARLGEVRLCAACEDAGFDRKYGVLPTRKGDVFSIMAWNFEDGISDHVNSRTLHLNLSGTGLTGTYRLAEYRIDQSHSNSNSVWKNMGAPPMPTPEQAAELRAADGLELIGEVMDIKMQDHVELNAELPMHAVSLFILAPKDKTNPNPVEELQAQAEDGLNGTRQVFLKWTPNTESNFLYYKVLRRHGDGDDSVISDNTGLNTAVYVDMDVSPGETYTYSVVSVNMSLNETRCRNEAVITT